MKNTFGNSVTVTIFGESHGAEIGTVIDGLAPGIPVDTAKISDFLEKRRPEGKISTARREADEFRILSGVFNGKTTGTPICITIPNSDTRSADYELTRWLPRPGHADYTAYMKYHGYEDYRGGGHFSGRITAALVAAGGIAASALEAKGIKIGTHIKSLGGIEDRSFDSKALERDIERLNSEKFAVLDDARVAEMKLAAEAAAASGDSVGGMLETAVTGMPAGVGEPWFDTVESVLSHILFAIPGIKGVSFGLGFEVAERLGSEVNDSFSVRAGAVETETNRCGGINGGITNGMPLMFSCAVRPTPSIRTEQNTVDLKSMSNSVISVGGRHDPAIIHRARIVVDSATALALCDLLAQRYGTDWLAPGEDTGRKR